MVAFSEGAPVPNAAITITRTAPAPADPAVNLTTNAQGQYSLTGLRSGTYTVSLAATTGCTTAANTQCGYRSTCRQISSCVPPKPGGTG